MTRALYLATDNEYKEIHDTLVMITGSCPIQKIEKNSINKLDSHQESVLFTSGLVKDLDLTPLKKKSKICLISGFNLFMFLDAILGMDTILSFEQYIEQIIENGKKSIDYFEREAMR